MNKALLYKARVSDALPADGQGLIYRESSGLYGPEDISGGGGGSSRIFSEKLLTAGDITAGYKDMVDPFPEWTKESDDAGYGQLHYFGRVVYFNGAYRFCRSGSAFESADGKVWSLASSPAFNVVNHCSEVFNGAMFVLDTVNGVVYKSTNGTTFSAVTITGSFPSARNHMASCVFDGKLWLMGGSTGGTEVYSSTDGEAWGLVTDAPGWTARQLFGAVVHNDEMFVMGGFPATRDVWKTTNGLNWTQVTALAGWAGRTTSNAIVSKHGKMWLIAGLNSATQENYGDYWYSADGATWATITDGITPGRQGHCMFDAGEELIVIGGLYSGLGVFGDCWSNPSDVVPVSLTPAKVQAHAIIGSRIYADDIWIRPTSNLVYVYDAEIRQWALLTEYTTLFEVETEPASGAVEGDVWIQTSTQDLYVYETDTWVLKYEEITLYEQQGRPVEYQVIALRNQARAAAGETSDFAADGSKIYFSNTDGKTNLSAILIEGNILIVEQLP